MVCEYICVYISFRLLHVLWGSWESLRHTCSHAQWQSFHIYVPLHFFGLSWPVFFRTCPRMRRFSNILLVLKVCVCCLLLGGMSDISGIIAFFCLFFFLQWFPDVLWSQCPANSRQGFCFGFPANCMKICSISWNNKHAIKAKIQQLNTKIGLRLELRKTLQMTTNGPNAKSFLNITNPSNICSQSIIVSLWFQAPFLSENPCSSSPNDSWSLNWDKK